MLNVVGIGQSHYADYEQAVSSPDIEIEQITPNVYTFTGMRGCDPSMVLTSEGAVFIDTAQWITQLEQMIEFAKETCGGVKYVINTESHIDHVFGNPYLKKEGATIVAQEKVLDGYYKIPPAFNMTTYEYNLDLLKRRQAPARGRGGNRQAWYHLQRQADAEGGQPHLRVLPHPRPLPRADQHLLP